MLLPKEYQPKMPNLQVPKNSTIVQCNQSNPIFTPLLQSVSPHRRGGTHHHTARYSNGTCYLTETAENRDFPMITMGISNDEKPSMIISRNRHENALLKLIETIDNLGKFIHPVHIRRVVCHLSHAMASTIVKATMMTTLIAPRASLI